jgi:hypothetical protein
MFSVMDKTNWHKEEPSDVRRMVNVMSIEENFGEL